MAGKKRKSEQVTLLNRSELLQRIKEIPDTRDKALAAFVYLTGCRISEILGHTKRIKHYHKEKLPNNKKVRVCDGTSIEHIEPLKKESVEFYPEKHLILVHQVPCLKRQGNVPRRNIPIIMTAEPELCVMFAKHYITLQPNEPLFSLTRQRAWQIINKELGLFTHFLIHERCTHLVTIKGFTDLDLKQFRGWSSTAMASNYTHLQWQDLAKKMV